MPKGGARVNSGPPPDPDALRRNMPSDRDGWTNLPAGGRTGAAPKWPLVRKDDPFVTARELEVWREIWKTPVAVAWERYGWTHDVAVYVRLLVQGEMGSVAPLTEARQWSDRLGLNPAAMLRNRWRIAKDEVTPRRAAPSAPAARPAARERLRSLGGDS